MDQLAQKEKMIKMFEDERYDCTMSLEFLEGDSPPLDIMKKSDTRVFFQIFKQKKEIK